jgi:hypothetical protein
VLPKLISLPGTWNNHVTNTSKGVNDSSREYATIPVINHKGVSLSQRDEFSIDQANLKITGYK